MTANGTVHIELLPAHGQGSGVAVEETQQQVADRINGYLTKSVEAILAAGAELIAEKKRRPGEFGKLFRDHADHVPQPLRISKRTAEVFMAIAKHPVLADAQHVAHLPGSWGTLGVLARLPAPVLEAAIRDGRVTPDLERRDAERLVADGGDDHEVAQVLKWIDLTTNFWGQRRLWQLATALLLKVDDLERRAQRFRDGDGERQVGALGQAEAVFVAAHDNAQLEAREGLRRLGNDGADLARVLPLSRERNVPTPTLQNGAIAFLGGRGRCIE